MREKILYVFGVFMLSGSLLLTGGGCSMFSSDKVGDEKDADTAKKDVKKDESKKDETKKDEAKKDEKKKPELVNLNDPKLSAEDQKTLVIAEKCADSIIIGMKNKDYKMFSEYLTDELKTDINPEKFKYMVASFDKEKGSYEGRTYIATLQKNFFRVYLWKAKYKKALTDKSKKDDLENDTLVRIIIGKVDDKYLVFGFSFQ